MKFWPLLKAPFLESIKFSKEQGLLSTSQRQAIIKIIEKKDSDKGQISSWRPISLLNIDYKIISKVLSSRIKQVLPSLIAPNQTAYVQNRFIGGNTRLISDILETRRLTLSAIILSKPPYTTIILEPSL